MEWDVCIECYKKIKPYLNESEEDYFNEKKKIKVPQSKGFNKKIKQVKPIERKKVFNILMSISRFATVALAFWAAMLTFLVLGENCYILFYADGYKPAVFTIKELRYYKSSSSGSGRHTTHTSAHSVAYGEIDGKKDQFKIGGFVEEPIESQSDLEKHFSVGQKLQVLYNPNIPKKIGIHIQYPEKDFKNKHKRWRIQIIKITYGPWIISFCIYLFLGFITKNYKGFKFVIIMSLVWMGMGWIFVSFYYLL